MNIFLFNTAWMGFNIYLALLPVIFSMFLLKVSHKLIRIVSGIFWFLYLPNTIYVFTDLHHLVEQWPIVNNGGRLILLMQYTILEVIGLICYLLAFYPAEILLNKINSQKRYHTVILIGLNFLLGFLMSLGKFERVNSWDVFLNPQFLFNSTFHFFSSFELIGLGILFGLFANFFYFLFRNKVAKFYKGLLKN